MNNSSVDYLLQVNISQEFLHKEKFMIVLNNVKNEKRSLSLNLATYNALFKNSQKYISNAHTL